MRKLLGLLFFFSLTGAGFAQSALQKAENFLKKQEYTEAKSQFQTVLDKEPDNKKALEGLGDVAAKRGKWDEALSYYKILVNEEPNNANYNFKYGGILGLKARNISKMKALFYISDIKEYLKKAAKLDPQHIEARWALCELYLELPGIVGGSNSTAEAYADQLMKIDPLNGYLAKARVAEEEDEHSKEKEYYKQALQIEHASQCEQKLEAMAKPTNELPENSDEKLGNACTAYSKNYLNYQIGKACALTGLQNWQGILYMKRYMRNYTAIDGVPPKWSYFRMAQLYKNLNLKSKAEHWIEKSISADGSFDPAENEKEKIEKM